MSLLGLRGRGLVDGADLVQPVRGQDPFEVDDLDQAGAGRVVVSHDHEGFPVVLSEALIHVGSALAHACNGTSTVA